jgi:hypoxanthine-guanine phosphoribosyltransferase
VPKVEIIGPMVEGKIPKGMIYLFQLVADQKSPSNSEALTIHWESSWFDLSILSQFALLILRAREQYHRIELNLQGATRSKIQFLWQCGFWESVQANYKSSNLVSTPDPWKSKPFYPASTFSPIYLLDAPENNDDALQIGDDRIKNAVTIWNEKLKMAECFSIINTTDVIKSQEYLYLLMWELIHNAYIHSKTKKIAISGQFFIAPNWLMQANRSNDLKEELIKNLKRQYELERRQKNRHERNQWIEKQKGDSFLLLTCVDTGIGIPRSLDRIDSLKTDAAKLQYSFTPWSSTRRQRSELLEAHGLSQIIQLVNNFDGYLFAESGMANLNWTRDMGFKVNDLKGLRLHDYGTRFEVLLPLTYKDPQYQKHKNYTPLLNHGTIKPANIERSSIFIAGVRHKMQAKSPNQKVDADQVIESVLKITDEIAKPVIYLDFGHINAIERQFVSSMLRRIRIRNSNRGIVVVNASEELLVKAKYLPTHNNKINDEDVKSWKELDKDLSEALSRGTSGSLPLLMPVLGSKPNEICWVGLGDMERGFRKIVETAIEQLINRFGETIPFFELRYQIEKELDLGIDLNEFQRKIESISRWNPWLLESGSGKVKSMISREDLLPINKSAFVKDIISKTKHIRPKGKESFAYSLSWHKKEKRLRREYYQTWSKLSDKHNRMVCAEHLVNMTQQTIGTEIADLSCVVSATPSAGLLGREIANILELPFYEAPSFYDVESFDWIPNVNGKALVVDDVLDTGELTSKLCNKLMQSGCKDGIVLTLMQNSDSRRDLSQLSWRIIACEQISLGKFNEDEAKAIYQKRNYYEIDPHTLKPELAFKGSGYSRMRFSDIEKERIQMMIAAGCIHYGHYVHGGHHFNVYMSLVNGLSDTVCRNQLVDWVVKSILQFSERTHKTKKDAEVILIYPYSSPIYRLIPILQMHLSLIADCPAIRYVIAQPKQLSGRRTNFLLSGLELKDLESADVVFLDDGIGTGSTISGIVDELIKSNSRRFRALIIFDRIGLQSRRHIKSTHQYRTPTGYMESSFESFLAINDRAATPSECHDCKVTKDLITVLENHPTDEFCRSLISSPLLRKMIVGSNEVPVSREFSKSDLMSLLEFRHAVYSDEPSPLEIEMSLEKRGGSVRLYCLSALLTDPKLFRQMPDAAKVLEMIKEDFTNSRTSSIARSRFVFSICSFVNYHFSSELLFGKLPLYYQDIIAQIGSVSAYFDINYEEFEIILASLYYFGRAVHGGRSEQKEVDLSAWISVFMPRTEDRRDTAFYVFNIRNLFTDKTQIPVEYLKHLYANFSGSFKEHRDSYRARIADFFLAPTEGNFRIIRSLLSQIASVQTAFLIDLIFVTDDQIKIVDQCHRKWMATGSVDSLKESLRPVFYPKDDLTYEPLVVQLIRHCTPSVSSIVDWLSEKSILSAGNSDRIAFSASAIDDVLRKVHVVGILEDIQHCIQNLIKNAFKAMSDYDSVLRSPDNLVNVSIKRMDVNFVAIEVIDFAPLKSGDNFEDWFNRSGGLFKHRSLLWRWGGDLVVKPNETGKTVKMILSVVSTEK